MHADDTPLASAMRAVAFIQAGQTIGIEGAATKVYSQVLLCSMVHYVLQECTNKHHASNQQYHRRRLIYISGELLQCMSQMTNPCQQANEHHGWAMGPHVPCSTCKVLQQHLTGQYVRLACLTCCCHCSQGSPPTPWPTVKTSNIVKYFLCLYISHLRCIRIAYKPQQHLCTQAKLRGGNPPQNVTTCLSM